SSAATINEWIPKLEERSLAGARMISFLELAERKASADARTEMLRSIRYKLASRYIEAADLTRAAEYLGNLLRDDTDQNRRRQLRAELMSVYINAGNLKAAGLLVANRLLEADISAESPLAKVIDDYIKNPNGAIEPSALLEELSKIDARTAGDRPKWKMQLTGWAKYLASIPKPAPEPQEANQPDFMKTS
ncbi:MAG: hypothetical protein WCZ89_04245, partial [Phycisphaerae bacterium]